MCVCLCVHALKQSVLCWNLLFVVIVITIISHVWMCVFVTVYTCVCVSTQSIDILQYCDIDACVCACVPV